MARRPSQTVQVGFGGGRLDLILADRYQAGTTVTRVHHLRGIECTYPENWQLSEEQEHDRLASFTLQSPNTAFMSVYVSRENGMARELIQEMTDLLSTEYEEIESSPIDSEALGLSSIVNGAEAVDLNFYYLDLLVTARLIAFSKGERTVLVQCQAEDREFETLQMVFKAMLISMLQPKKKKPHPT